MRIFLSAILLAIFGDKKGLKCSTGEELTNSYVPAGLQTVHHYLSQIRESQEIYRKIPGGVHQMEVPTIVVSYDFEDDKGSEIEKKLMKLGSALDDEASEQDLAECTGITSEVMQELEINSRSSSRSQLSFILKKIVSDEVKNRNTKAVILEILPQLENDRSDFTTSLESVAPLKYLSDLSLE